MRDACAWLVGIWVVAATAKRRWWWSGSGGEATPPSSSSQQRALAVIGVLSPPGHFAQRALIRQTYARDPPEGMVVRFVVGEVVEEGESGGDNNADGNNKNSISRDAQLGPDDLWKQGDGNLRRALKREAEVFGDLAWGLPTLKGVRDDRAHMARKTLGWFQAAAAGGGGGGGGGSLIPSIPDAEFVLKTDDDVVLHLGNLKRRLERVLYDGELLEKEKDARGRERRRAAAAAPSSRNPLVYFGRPITSPVFGLGPDKTYMQGSLYGFSRALAKAVAETTTRVSEVRDEEDEEGGGGAAGVAPNKRPHALLDPLYFDAVKDPAPVEGHEDFLASRWVLNAVVAAGVNKKGGERPPPPAVQWANASSVEVHDTPLIASPFSLRVISPEKVIAVHNAKHPLEFMHAYGGTIGLGGGGGGGERSAAKAKAREV